MKLDIVIKGYQGNCRMQEPYLVTSIYELLPFLSPHEVSRRGLLKWVRPSVRRHNEMGNLWTTPLTVFNQSFWNLAGAFVMVWRCTSGFGVIFLLFFFYFLCFHFFDLIFFSGQITIRKYTLWAQLLLEFSTIILKLCILVHHGL